MKHTVCVMRTNKLWPQRLDNTTPNTQIIWWQHLGARLTQIKEKCLCPDGSEQMRQQQGDQDYIRYLVLMLWLTGVGNYYKVR